MMTDCPTCLFYGPDHRRLCEECGGAGEIDALADTLAPPRTVGDGCSKCGPENRCRCARGTPADHTFACPAFSSSSSGACNCFVEACTTCGGIRLPLECPHCQGTGRIQNPSGCICGNHEHSGGKGGCYLSNCPCRVVGEGP